MRPGPPSCDRHIMSRQKGIATSMSAVAPLSQRATSTRPQGNNQISFLVLRDVDPDSPTRRILQKAKTCAYTNGSLSFERIKLSNKSLS